MRRLIVLIAVLLLGSVVGPVSAQNVLEEELEEIAREIAELEAEMAEAQGDVSYYQSLISTTNGRMNEIRAKQAAAEAVLADLDVAILETNTAISFTELEISQKEAELARTSANIADTHDLVVTRAVEMFKRGGGQLQVTFDYDSVQDAAVAVKYGSAVLAETNKSLDVLKELRSQELQQVDLIEEQKAKLSSDLARLADAQAQAVVVRQNIEENRKQIEAELINQQALLQTIKNEAAAIDLELEGLEAEQAKVEEIIAEAQRSGGVAPGTLYPPVKPFRIVSSYGPRLHPILGYTRTHAGIDLDGDSGQEIYAADSGRVIYAGVRGGYGNTVIIDHGGGLATLYAHQSSIAVRNGANVTVGDVIGYIGSTGLSTGPHLHFEVRLSGAHTDPAPYFQ